VNDERPTSPTVYSGTVNEAMISLFGDEELSDVRLQGSDGGQVVAVKAVLAARSPMFRQKFFGSTSNTVIVPLKPGEKDVVVYNQWDCRILHLIVEYCYTDTCSVMKGQPTEDIARLLAVLRTAAKVFKLPGLLNKIKQWVWRQVSRHPAIACAMVDEGMRRDDVDELALQTLQLKTRAALLPAQRAVGSGVLSLSKPGLLFVLRTLEETTSHFLLLQVLERWVEFSSEDDSGDSPEREKGSREAFARKCATRFIKISDRPEENMAAVMQRSHLFTSNNNITTSLMHSDSLKFTTSGGSNSLTSQ